MSRKQRVAFKTTPEQFIDNWLKTDGNIAALAKIYGGVTSQTVSNYATYLRKQNVKLPKAKALRASSRGELTPEAVKALNAKLTGK